jgi:hypothetical protein
MAMILLAMFIIIMSVQKLALRKRGWLKYEQKKT